MLAVLLVLWVAVCGAAVWLLLGNQRYKRRVAQLTRDNGKLSEQLALARARNEVLSKYEGISDVEAHVADRQRFAQATVDDARALGAALVEAAQKRASAMVDEANVITRKEREVADHQVASARVEASAIIDAATKRAQEVAGDALAAVQNAKQAEDIVRAMKNVIEGYGDSYLVPTYTVLDELGDELSFTEAGQKLKLARDRMRDLVKRGQAAACDYAEPNRRETAIHFVLDAFMGKCDSVLADVRHDNFGTLQQKLKDAFSLVNKNGQAFRNARMVQSFLDARIDELKWAVAAHELKVREREEQRVLKERLREEERAQREFDKAMKDAAKEEDTLRKAMDKARKEIERASDEQRATYEAKLAELGDRLRAAEEKNQRAKSMAQQTKQGVVYVISNIGSFGEHVYKIGMTRRYDPLERVRELGDASVPFEFDVHALIRAEDAPALERRLHKRCIRHQMNKVNPRKEFFRVGLQEIRQIADQIGCETLWTMTAECREYKETLVVEQRMASRKIEESAWIEQQLKVQDSLPPEPENDRLEIAS